MRMEVEVLPESMNGHNDTGHALGLIQRCAHDITNAFVRDPAEVFEQIAVITEIRPEHFWDGEGDMPMGYGKKDGLGEQGSEELNLLLVARRTKPATFAREREQVVFLTSVFALRATPRQGGHSGCGRTRVPDRRSP